MSAAQVAPGGDDSNKYKLEGTVVNSVTGEPVPHVVVELMGGVQRVLLTGNDGRFQFDDLAPGQVFLWARKPGFGGPSGQSRRNMGSNAIEIGPRTSPLTVKLLPESVIAGHVEDADGEPLEGIMVRAVAPFIQQGRKRLVPVAQATTNEDGNFRMANIFAGRCYVALLPNPQAARGPVPKEGYPAIVYYPDATDMASATPVQLVSGRPAEVQFLLKKEPVFQISGAVIGIPPGENFNLQIKTASGDGINFVRQPARQPGTFEIHSVPAGTYRLEATRTAEGQPPLFAELPLTVARDITGIQLAFEPMQTIPVVAKAESTATPAEGGPGPAAILQSVRVQLHSDDLFRNMYAGLRTAGNVQSMEISNVAPGTYTAEVSPPWGRWYVQSARYGALDLLREPLVITRGGRVSPIEVTLRDDSAVLTGSVQAERPVNLAIVVVSESAPTQPPKEVYSDANGRFTANALAPGSYKVFAFDTAEQVEYTNPEVLRDYDSKAARVVLQPNGKAEVTVEPVRLGD